MPMISIKDIQAKFESFFFDDMDLTGFFIFRKLFSIMLFISGIGYLVEVKDWYGPNSLMSAQIAKDFMHSSAWSALSLLPDTVSVVTAVIIIFLGLCVCLYKDWQPRVVSLLLFILANSLQNRAPLTNNSCDDLMRILLFLLIFAPDSKSTNQLFFKNGTWVVRLIQLQILWVYLSTAIQKFYGRDWVDGTAVYYAANYPDMNRGLDLTFMAQPVFISQFLTATTLAVEFLLSFLVWIKETRLVILLMAIGLHLGIEATISVSYFEWTMIACLFCFILNEDLMLIKNKIAQFKKARA